MSNASHQRGPSGRDESPRMGFFLTALLFEGGLAGFALGLGWTFSQRPVAGLDFVGHSAAQWAAAVLWGLAATVPLVSGLLAIDRWGERLFPELTRIVNEQIGPLFAPLSLWRLLLLSIAAGVGEELLFRGFLQGLLAEVVGQPWGRPAAVAIASLVFGLCHCLSRAYFLLATLIGAYLGLLWLATGSLLAPIVTHSAYDFVALWWFTRVKLRAGESR